MFLIVSETVYFYRTQLGFSTQGCIRRLAKGSSSSWYYSEQSVAIFLSAFLGRFKVICNSFILGSNNQQLSRIRRSNNAKIVFKRVVARYLYRIARTSPWPYSKQLAPYSQELNIVVQRRCINVGVLYEVKINIIRFLPI